jgi:very-short-patch-repair endonuclease
MIPSLIHHHIGVVMDRFHRRGTIRGTRPFTSEAARRLRSSMTATEKRLWDAVRARKLEGMKFRRQYPFGDYILDFCAPAIKLAIEVDGSIHLGTRDADRKRTEELEIYGYQVLRFSNDEIIHDLDHVLCRIRQTIQALTRQTRLEPSAPPPPKRNDEGP